MEKSNQQIQIYCTFKENGESLKSLISKLFQEYLREIDVSDCTNLYNC